VMKEAEKVYLTESQWEVMKDYTKVCLMESKLDFQSELMREAEKVHLTDSQ